MIWAKLAGFVLALHVATATELRFSKELSSDFVFRWDYDEENITVELSAPTVGWVGIGFSQTKTMKDADLIFAGVRNGQPYAWDAWSSMTGVVDIDLKQDVEVINGVENDTHTTVKLKRPLAGIGKQDNSVTNGVTNVLWAFGKVDKLKRARRSDYHRSDKGHLEIVLLRHQKKPSDQQVESSTLEAQRTNSVPAISSKSTEPTTTDLPSDEKTVDTNISLDFPFSIPLDINQTVHLLWYFDEDYITLQLTAPSTGWIGIGFSQTSSMRGADMIIMGKTAEGVYALDTHSDENKAPKVDSSQDIEIISGIENGTHTTVTVKRKRVTCDDDDMSLKDGTYRVIWAYGEKDLVGEYPDAIDYHGKNKGAKSLKLINPLPRNVKGSSDEYFDIASNNFTVPALDTFYLCRAIQIPDSIKKRHVLRISPNLQPGNEKNIHHIIIYICDGEVDAEIVGKHLTCYTEVNPWGAGCVRTLAGWAVGMSDIIFPPDVGFPIGGGKDKYVMLQTHYDNPEMREFQDNSGMRFYYTEDLLEIDAGLLTISASLNTIWAPPGVERFRVNGHCSEICFSRGMDLTGIDEITVIGTGLHSHLAGRKLVLHHYRDGKELKPFARDDHYDFDYQETQYVDDGTVKIKKGDSFTVNCDYSTIGRDRVLTGGLSTRHEMCNAFLVYYPLIKLDYCDSAPDIFNPSALLQLAAGLNISVSFEEGAQLLKRISEDPYDAMAILATVLNRAEWTEEKKRFAETFMNNLNQSPICVSGDSWLMSYQKEKFPVPTNEEYLEEDECKLEETENDYTERFSVTFIGASTILLILLGAGLSIRKS